MSTHPNIHQRMRGIDLIARDLRSTQTTTIKDTWTSDDVAWIGQIADEHPRPRAVIKATHTGTRI